MEGFWAEIYSNHAISMITMDITVAASSYLGLFDYIPIFTIKKLIQQSVSVKYIVIIYF
ncbi:MAG: hypothetical protein ACJ0O0_06555 [Flavobacteriaceae bacterium]